MSFRTKILATLALFMLLVCGMISVLLIADATRRARAERERAQALAARLADDWVRSQPTIAWAIEAASAPQADPGPIWAEVQRRVGGSRLVQALTVVEYRPPSGLEVRSASDGSTLLPGPQRELFERLLRGPEAPLCAGGAVYLRLDERDPARWLGRLDLGPALAPPDTVGPAVRQILGLMGVGMVLLLLVVTVLLNRLVLRPVQALSEASARIAQSDFSRPAPAPASYDEINRMVESFNMMMERVGQYARKLNEQVRQVEARAHTTERRLVAAQRLSTTGSLAAGVAHEINNPLGGLINAAAALGRGDLPEAKRAEYVALIQEGLERIREIVGQLLKFTPRPFEKRPTDLRAVVERALSLAAHRAAERGALIDYAPPAALGTVEADAAELQQAVLNILLNALDAVPAEGGRVAVELRQEPDAIELAIEDNGCGMSAEQLAHCLEPFFTTKAPGQGSGIGLAVAHSIVSNHGGHLSIESEPGRGTRVGLQFPRSGPPSTGPVSRTAEQRVGLSSGGKA
jgi:signal transduction histidine kinase